MSKCFIKDNFNEVDGFCIYLKYVAGVSWKENTMKVFYKTGNYDVIENVSLTNFKEIQQTMAEYLEEKGK